MEGFGERLVKARKKLGLTQKQLAKQLDITPTRLNYWEKDKREPNLLRFSQIVKLLNADANELLGISNSENIKYDVLNTTGKAKVDSYIDGLIENSEYTLPDDINIAAENQYSAHADDDLNDIEHT